MKYAGIVSEVEPTAIVIYSSDEITLELRENVPGSRKSRDKLCLWRGRER